MTGRKVKTVLGVMLAQLLLLIGTFTPAIELMMPEQVSCGMACCLASGVCYCSTSHSASPSLAEDHGHSSGEETPDDADAPRTVETTGLSIGSSCSQQCAQIPSGFQKLSIVKAGVSKYTPVTNTSQLIYASAPHFARDALADDSSAPRAPPATLL